MMIEPERPCEKGKKESSEKKREGDLLQNHRSHELLRSPNSCDGFIA
jgi:hypothetical protein